MGILMKVNFYCPGSVSRYKREEHLITYCSAMSLTAFVLAVLATLLEAQSKEVMVDQEMAEGL